MKCKTIQVLSPLSVMNPSPLPPKHHNDAKHAVGNMEGSPKLPSGFSLGLDDMEGDLSPPIWGGTSTGGQSSNRGGRMGRDIYFMGGDPYFE